MDSAVTLPNPFFGKLSSPFRGGMSALYASNVCAFVSLPQSAIADSSLIRGSHKGAVAKSKIWTLTYLIRGSHKLNRRASGSITPLSTLYSPLFLFVGCADTLTPHSSILTPHSVKLLAPHGIPGRLMCGLCAF